MEANAFRAVILIRVLVGWVFVSEGIQKVLYPASVGAGRFARIGLPQPEFLAALVATVEIVCGALVLLGLFTRWAVVPLLIVISTAILATKLPILLGHGFWGFTAPKLERYGLWSMLHEARTDVSMLLGLLFLRITGAGKYSMDEILRRRP
jgi:uncharacterized membrane protein YphA (DoxX/SURF4 family)